MSTLPRILISASPTGAANYTAAVSAAGGLAFAVYCPKTPSAKLAENYDGLVLAGGGDLLPEYYGQPLSGSRNLDPQRDRFELALTDAFLQAEKPIFGVCRGFQLLNVFFGGDLVQAMTEPQLSQHAQQDGEDRLHPTRIADGSFLARLYGAQCLVNSAHHQAVKRPGEGLIFCQWTEDGVPEGFSHARLPVWGVQWHPERCCLSYAREGLADGLALWRFFTRQCRVRL